MWRPITRTGLVRGVALPPQVPPDRRKFRSRPRGAKPPSLGLSMKFPVKTAKPPFQILTLALFTTVSTVHAGIKPGAFDLAAVRDTATLETRVVQDWKPA